MTDRVDPADPVTPQLTEEETIENREWLESLDYVLHAGGRDRVIQLLDRLTAHARQRGVDVPVRVNTPYVNSIPLQDQAGYPGDLELEQRIEAYLRWNAMAMVVRANKKVDGIGGHISTYASAATLYEVGFNHFWRGHDHDSGADLLFIQGHGSPGIYARAFLEGRLDESQLNGFRQESAGGGLSSYPHPWLMPDFWQFPTVSMGLGPLQAAYQARFNRYLENRSLKPASDQKVWAFVGDGESDEPETFAAASLAAREGLDNLILVVNCNLQRLDGPVRGNGKIVQELEGRLLGAGWNVIKVVWSGDWDPLLTQDSEGLLVRRMTEAVDGEYQKYKAAGGSYIRENFFGKYAELREAVSHLSDDDLVNLRRGGHDAVKVHAAFKAASEHRGQPTVILAKTVKGFGLGEAAESKNATHQQKKLELESLRHMRDRFGLPISDEMLPEIPFIRPADDSPELAYLRQRRMELGGSLPERRNTAVSVSVQTEGLFEEFEAGTDGRAASTTMVLVRLLGKLLRDKEVGKLIVPIIPDEARTFGMESLFSQIGIYAPSGQLYEPVDKSGLMYYRESSDGQILEEGITEAGAMASFIAAGTANASHGLQTIPFYVFYSMFGFQRVGDLIWAAADQRTRGFLIGATSGRTTLNGEGLQHEDGHSHLLAYPVPNLKAYDPAYAYEISAIVDDGMKRMYGDGEDVLYYITVHNDNYAQPALPSPDVREGILKGIYKVSEAGRKRSKLKAHLFGSGAILNSALEAQKILESQYSVATDVWSVTSYKELHQDALAAERWNLRNPASKKPRKAYLEKALEGSKGVFVAASDYVKALPESIARFLPGPLVSLGTDGFGRSDTREALRDFFEVDANHIVAATLGGLAREGTVSQTDLKKAIKELGIDPSKADPVLS